MAVSRKFTCDISGDEIHPDAVLVVRVGTLANRPDAAERFDVGVCCYSDGPLRVLYDKMIALRTAAGQDKNGEPIPDARAYEQEQEQAAARA